MTKKIGHEKREKARNDDEDLPQRTAETDGRRTKKIGHEKHEKARKEDGKFAVLLG